MFKVLILILIVVITARSDGSLVQCISKKFYLLLEMLAFKYFLRFHGLGTKNFWALAILCVVYECLVAVQNEEDKGRILSIIQNWADVFLKTLYSESISFPE